MDSWKPRSVILVGLGAFAIGCVVVALVLAWMLGGEDDSIACDSPPRGSSVELVYGFQAQPESISGVAREETVDVICRRLRGLGMTDAYVTASKDRVQVVLPGYDANAERAIEQVGSTAQLHFYDWEPNLLGREALIGGSPGSEPPQAAINEANEEWKEAGRDIFSQENQQLIFSGAFPTAWAAVDLAEKQEPRPGCTDCSNPGARHYLFSSDARRLLAGPEPTREALFATASDGIVKTVPPGAIVVSEQPSDANGRVLKNAEPGWYALNDRPVLSGADIRNPEQSVDEWLGAPNVVFEFTDEGRDAFQRVTRQIAQRGQARAIGPASGEQAEQTSGRFAIVLDNEVRTRPLINFAENPDGIDGRTGAQISGGFTSVQEAQDLATFLQIGALPIDLKLISQSG